MDLERIVVSVGIGVYEFNVIGDRMKEMAWYENGVRYSCILPCRYRPDKSIVKMAVPFKLSRPNKNKTEFSGLR